jgi:hypothetical protein
VLVEAAWPTAKSSALRAFTPAPPLVATRHVATVAVARGLARQAGAAYRRLVIGWQASGPKAGAGATPERASSRPSKGKAARQATSS